MRAAALVLVAMLLFAVSASPASGQQEIKVASHSHYVDKDGLLYVVGEVENNLARAVGGVKIYATFHDSGGKIVATKAAGAFIGDLRPGEKSPFSIAVADPGDAARIAGYRLAATSDRPAQAREPYLSVQAGQGNIDEKGVYRLAGKLVNYGDRPATGIVAAASFYNASNHVIHAAYRYFPAGILQTEILQFEFQLGGDRAGKVASASVNAYCLEYSSMAAAWKSKYPLTVAADSPSYGNGEEIRVSGNITAAEGYVIIEIRRSDRMLHDRATAVISEGRYEKAIRFYASPEYRGQDFIIKVRYKGSFAETMFKFS